MESLLPLNFCLLPPPPHSFLCAVAFLASTPKSRYRLVSRSVTNAGSHTALLPLTAPTSTFHQQNDSLFVRFLGPAHLQIVETECRDMCSPPLHVTPSGCPAAWRSELAGNCDKNLVQDSNLENHDTIRLEIWIPCN